MQKVTVQKPREGEYFEIVPSFIIQNLSKEFFSEEREDLKQEKTRQTILAAIEMVKSNPRKYGRTFYTLVPKKTWEAKQIDELEEKAQSMGDHMADWVEQALEWAQRLVNGESWEDLCNKVDTLDWYRLVIWKEGYVRRVGGATQNGSRLAAADVSRLNKFSFEVYENCVPLVVSY